MVVLMLMIWIYPITIYLAKYLINSGIYYHLEE